MFHYHTKCRACGSPKLEPTFSFGPMPLANDFQTESGECAGYAPLTVLCCERCSLAQLSVVVKPQILYANYPYVTSKSKTMTDHFDLVWKHLSAAVPGNPKRTKTFEIGSNDGSFLESLPLPENYLMGMEPAANLAEMANKKSIFTKVREFNEPSAIELAAQGYKADLIVARHVFAHVDNWQGFVRGLEQISHKGTLVFIEVPWVVDMLGMRSIDQIYAEHLSYVSIGAIKALLEPTEFGLFGVKRYSVHGGAIGLFLKHKSVGSVLPEAWFESEEKNLAGQWRDLSETKYIHIRQFRELLNQQQTAGKVICGFGASAKATVWLNALNARRHLVSWVCDDTEQKQGKLVPGTNIEVAPEDMLMKANVAINFAWNFHEFIADKWKAFTDKGGRWIVPVPEPKLL